MSTDTDPTTDSAQVVSTLSKRNLMKIRFESSTLEVGFSQIEELLNRTLVDLGDMISDKLVKSAYIVGKIDLRFQGGKIHASLIGVSPNDGFCWPESLYKSALPTTMENDTTKPDGYACSTNTSADPRTEYPFTDTPQEAPPAYETPDTSGPPVPPPHTEPVDPPFASDPPESEPEPPPTP